jgi:hypothetical protein
MSHGPQKQTSDRGFAMAWYFISLNFLFAAIVLGAILGSHAWAIATQHRDWPHQDETASKQATRQRPLLVGLFPRPAV